MWLAISVPLMVLGVAVAVVPVLVWSLRDHGQGLYRADGWNRESVAPVAVVASPVERAVSCPLCSESVRAREDAELVDGIRRHAWQTHGIPSEDHILESASVV